MFGRATRELPYECANARGILSLGSWQKHDYLDGTRSQRASCGVAPFDLPPQRGSSGSTVLTTNGLRSETRWIVIPPNWR